MSIIRDITIKAQKDLKQDEIFLFIGARQAGKTTILKQLEDFLKKQGEICYFLRLEDPDYLKLLNESPKNLFKIFPIDLSKKSFVFIDEIQYLDNPSNFLKYFYDEYAGKIKLLVSGSSAFYIDQKFKDSLAGRKKIFNVLTLSFREFLRFKEENDLLKKNFSSLTLSEIEKISIYFREFIIYGGYPRVVLSKVDQKKEVLQELAYSYIKKDILESNVRQDEIFYKMFKILSSQIGNLFNASELASTLGVSKSSIDNYIYIMQKSFHIRLVRPFFKKVRKEMIKMPKVYFLDLGLRNFFTGNFDLFDIRNDKGMLLENIVYRQLIDNIDFDEVRFWRTIQGDEIDFVVENNAFEIKTSLSNFRIKKYKRFLENYPEMKLSVVVLDSDKNEIDNFPVIKPWGI